MGRGEENVFEWWEKRETTLSTVNINNYFILEEKR